MTLSSSFTASNNHPLSSSRYPARSGSFYNSPGPLQTALTHIDLPNSSSAMCPKIFLKRSYKHVFLLPKNTVSSHCPPHYKLLSLTFRRLRRGPRLAPDSFPSLRLLHRPATLGFLLFFKCPQNFVMCTIFAYTLSPILNILSLP